MILWLQLQADDSPALPTCQKGTEGCWQLCLRGLPSPGGTGMHMTQCDTVNSHECLWPLNFAKAWLRYAPLRTKQLVLGAHLLKEGFAFPAVFAQIGGLNNGCRSLPQTRSVDLYLYGLANTPSLLPKVCATAARTAVCGLSSCRPLLSDVLRLKKPRGAPGEGLTVNWVPPQTCQHWIHQTGTGLNHAVWGLFAVL